MFVKQFLSFVIIILSLNQIAVVESKKKRKRSVHTEDITSRSVLPSTIPWYNVTDELVEEWIGEWIFSPSTKKKVRAAFDSLKPYQINPFLRPDKADKLHAEIYKLADKDLLPEREGYEKEFQFNHFNLYEEQDKIFNRQPTMQQLHEILNSQYVRDWFQDVSNIALDNRTISSVSYYKPLSFSMVHSDYVDQPNGAKRAISFVMHMSKDFDVRFGGDLIYVNPLTLIHAGFNNMVLFITHPKSFHLVSPISRRTPDFMKRLAYSGWWVTTQHLLPQVGNGDL